MVYLSVTLPYKNFSLLKFLEKRLHLDWLKLLWSDIVRIKHTQQMANGYKKKLSSSHIPLNLCCKNNKLKHQCYRIFQVNFSGEFFRWNFSGESLRVKFFSWNFLGEIFQVKFFRWNFSGEIFQGEILQVNFPEEKNFTKNW